MQIRDGDWVLHDSDPLTGRTTWLYYHPDGAVTVREDYPVESTIDLNTAQRNLAEKGWRGDYHQVASVPLNIFYSELVEASRQGDDKHISRWLNDSDNRAWRTKEGNV